MPPMIDLAAVLPLAVEAFEIVLELADLDRVGKLVGGLLDLVELSRDGRVMHDLEPCAAVVAGDVSNGLVHIQIDAASLATDFGVFHFG
jgi:hypothetical protein